jgi:hypothetical protein
MSVLSGVRSHRFNSTGNVGFVRHPPPILGANLVEISLKKCVTPTDITDVTMLITTIAEREYG